MEFIEAKKKFIANWGSMCINWGFNRTMGQIHGLLLVSPDPLCTDDIMEELKISRGNVNLNIRTLLDWGLVRKYFEAGDRKEYFVAEKDLWKVLTNIIKQRKKKELDPMQDLFKELSSVKAEDKASEEFVRTIKDLSLFSQRANSTINNLLKTEAGWLMGSFFGLSR